MIPEDDIIEKLEALRNKTTDEEDKKTITVAMINIISDRVRVDMLRSFQPLRPILPREKGRR